MPRMPAGVTRLSQLQIDAIKDWGAYRIENLGAPNSDDDAPRARAADILSGRFGMARMPDGTLGYVLTFQGAGVDPVAAAASPVDIFNKFRECISWTSLDGYTVGGDAGYIIVPWGATVKMNTTNVINSDAWIKSTDYWYNLVDAGKVVTFDLVLNDIGADTNTWLRFATSTTDPPTETANHLGWKIIGSRVWASNGDGVNQTITDTGVDVPVAQSQRTRLKIIFNPGTSIKFYINDVLAATHTTNLPGLGIVQLHFHVRTTVAAPREAWMGRVLIEKEHA